MKTTVDIVSIVVGIAMLFFAIWGTLDFKGFKESYIRYCDKRNPLGIPYPKGAYLTFTLKGMIVVMYLVSGTIIVFQTLSKLGIVTLVYY